MAEHTPAPRTGDRSWLQTALSGELLVTAAVAGVASGSICVFVRLVLAALQWCFTGHGGFLADAAGSMPVWRRILTPVFGAALATLTLYLSRNWLHYGRSVDYVEAVRFRGGRIPFLPTFWRTLASAFSIATGAAIGREGSMIQFASASVGGLGTRFQRSGFSLTTVVALASAGAVAAVYQAPLGALFFALEIVLGVRALSKRALLQAPALLLAASLGSTVSYHLLDRGPLFAVTKPLHFHWQDTLPLLACAILIAALGPVYFHIVESMRFLKRWPLAMLWSGLVVGLCSWRLPQVWGNGDTGVLQVISGSTSPPSAALLLLLRLLATAACVGSGVVGGVFTPTIFAGSVLGLLSAAASRSLFGAATPPIEFAIVGIVCLLAAVTHAPFMAALMTAELTGTLPWLPVLLLCSLLSFQVARTLSRDRLYAVASTDPGRVTEASKQEQTAAG